MLIKRPSVVLALLLSPIRQVALLRALWPGEKVKIALKIRWGRPVVEGEEEVITGSNAITGTAATAEARSTGPVAAVW